MLKNIIDNFINTDLISFLMNKYDKISSLDKKTFLYTFIMLNLCFLFHTVTYIYGDHDNFTIINGINWNTFLFEGRFSCFLLKILFTKSQIIPIINNLFAFFLFSLGCVFLLNFWEAPKNTIQRCIITSIITIQPYTLCWLWYQLHSIENLGIPLFVTLALIISLNNKSLSNNLLSILLFLFSLGIYPTAIVNIFTIFTSKIIIDTINNKNTNIKSFINNYKNIFYNIIISLCLYKLILYILKHLHILRDMQNIQQASFIMMLSNTKVALNSFFTQLFHYRIVDHSTIAFLFGILLSILIFFGLYQVIKRKILFKTLLIIILSLILIISTKFAVILSIMPYEVAHWGRIDFYGLVFFRAFIILLIFKYTSVCIKNITYIITFLILLNCICVNGIIQKAFFLGKQNDLMICNRIVQFIESNINYSLDKKYNIITIGQYPKPSIPQFIPKKLDKDLQYELGGHSLYPQWSPAELITNFLTNKDINKIYIFNFDENDIRTNLKTEQLEIIKRANKDTNGELMAFPSKNSVKVVDNYIIICFTKSSTEKIKELIK